MNMTRKEAIGRIQEHIHIHSKKEPFTPYLDEAFDMAIEALMDNKPSRTWIAKNEYRRGWHDAIIKALAEVQKIYIANETFEMVQKETLIGLGLSMDSALGAEPYSDTEESYPEPEQPHGKWIPCSERLPEENGWYIGSKVTPKGNHMTNSFWYEDGTFFTLGEVEAWMSLPEPYKEEGEQK